MIPPPSWLLPPLILQPGQLRFQKPDEGVVRSKFLLQPRNILPQQVYF